MKFSKKISQWRPFKKLPTLGRGLLRKMKNISVVSVIKFLGGGLFILALLAGTFFVGMLAGGQESVVTPPEDDYQYQRIDYITQIKNCRNIDGMPPMAREASGQLREEFAETSFRMMSLLEQTWEDSPALALVFSKPVAENFSRQISVAKVTKNGKVLEQLTSEKWILDPNGNIAYFPFVDPNTYYQVKAFRGLTSINREGLPGDFTRIILTAKRRPSVAFISCGTLFSPELADGMPIRTYNVDRVNIDFWKIRPSQILPFFSRERNSTYELASLGDLAEMVYSGNFQVDGAGKNESRRSLIDLKEITALQEPGIYFMVMKGAGDYPYQYATTWFSKSDIGVQVRMHPDRLTFFTHSFLNTQPLGGVNIRILFEKDYPYAEIKTDPQGFAQYSRGVEREVMALVENQNGLSVVPFNQLIDLSDFSSALREQGNSEMFLYGPRSLYRPGETVTVNGLLRDYRGKIITPEEKVKFVVVDPTGSEVSEGMWRPEQEEMGFYTTAIRTDRDSKTGKWEFRAQVREETFVYPFTVEDFLPEQLRITLEPGSLFIEPNHDLSIQAEAVYFYGSPAAGNNWQAEIQVRPIRSLNRFLSRNDYFGKPQLFSRWKDYVFGQEEVKNYNFDFLIEGKTLDQQGRVEVSHESEWKDAEVPLRVSTVMNVFTDGGRPNSRSVEQVVLPEPGLVGVKPLFRNNEGIAEPYSDLQFEIARFLPDGNLGEGKYDVEISRVSDNYFLSDRNRWRYERSKDSQPIFFRTLRLQGDPQTISFSVRYGDYLLSIREPGGGDLILTYHFFAGWVWDRGSRNQPLTAGQIPLQWDKKEYSPGDQAKLRFQPPYSGRALVTVENDQLLWKKEFEVDQDGEVVIPIGGDWEGNDLYASVHIFRPLLDLKKGKDPFPDISQRALGLIHVPLKHSHQKLHPEIVIGEKLRSGSRMEVKIKLSQEDLNSQDSKNTKTPVYVTLAAVDSGVLSVNNYRTPDPFAHFFEPRKYPQQITDNYGEIIRPFRLPTLRQRFGGDADIELMSASMTMAGDQVKTEVAIVSLFSEAIAFDHRGEAVVAFELPEFNGELRLMVVAFDDTRYGSDEKNVKVVSPLITDLGLPRFLAYQDEAFAALHLQNNTAETKTYLIDLGADQPLGGSRKEESLTLKANEKKVLRLPLTAKLYRGRGVVSLRVEEKSSAKDKFRLNREWGLPIRPLVPAELYSISQVVEPKDNRALMIEEVKAMVLEGRKALLQVSDRPPINFEIYLRNLIRYPYGCLEQTTSRAFPLLLAKEEELRKYDQSQNQNITKERAALLSAAIAKLAGMQKENGGFGLWGRDSREEHWLTAFVMDFLLRAKNQGYPVPQQTLDAGLSRMKEYLFRSRNQINIRYHYTTWPEHYFFSLQAYSALVLSGVDEARLSDLRLIYDRGNTQAQSPLPLAQFALALENAGDLERAEKAWKQALNFLSPGEGYTGDYGGEIRDLAWMMVLAEESKLKIDGLQRIYELNDLIENRRWLSTQENLALFRLSQALAAKGNRKWKAEVDFSGQKKTYEMIGALSLFREDRVLPSASVENQNDFNLYAGYQVQGYPRQPHFGIREGMRLYRSFFDQNGKALDLGRLKTGDLVVAKVRVESESRLDLPNVLVADLLPAGLELENQNLAHSTKIGDFLINGVKIADTEEKNPVDYREYRDDRFIASFRLNRGDTFTVYYLMRAVTPGKYHYPPGLAEDMYRPYLRAVGDEEPVVRIEGL